MDSQIKVWDVRKFTPLHTYYAHTPATQLDISQKGLLAVAHGRKVQVRHAGGEWAKTEPAPQSCNHQGLAHEEDWSALQSCCDELQLAQCSARQVRA